MGKGKTKNENLFIFHQNKTQKTSGKVKKKKGGDGKEDGWPPCAAWLFIIVQDTHTHTREREERKTYVPGNSGDGYA